MFRTILQSVFEVPQYCQIYWKFLDSEEYLGKIHVKRDGKVWIPTLNGKNIRRCSTNAGSTSLFVSDETPAQALSTLWNAFMESPGKTFELNGQQFFWNSLENRLSRLPFNAHTRASISSFVTVK